MCSRATCSDSYVGIIELKPEILNIFSTSSRGAAHINFPPFDFNSLAITRILRRPRITSYNVCYTKLLRLTPDKKLRTISVALSTYSTGTKTDYTFMMAALVSTSLPLIIIYLLFSTHVIKGMTAGAVKG